MQVRLNKKNAEYMDYIISIKGWTVNEIIEDLIHKQPVNSNVQDLSKLIYEDTQFIVNSIKSKAEKNIKTADSKNFMKNESENTVMNWKRLSEKQAAYYNDKYNGYKKNFEQSESRGTDSKLIEDLYVFETWNNEINHQLHIDLGMLVLEKDVDWTEYMDEKFYNYLN